MKCDKCGSNISTINDLTIQIEFDNCYCSTCGEFFGEIDKTDVMEKNNRIYKAEIKLYIKKQKG